MADYAEKMLRYGGKLMQCLDELDEESDMGERDDDMGYRGRMGNRHTMGRRMRDDMGEREDWDDDDDDMGERRGRNSRGRYTRR